MSSILGYGGVRKTYSPTLHAEALSLTQKRYNKAQKQMRRFQEMRLLAEKGLKKWYPKLKYYQRLFGHVPRGYRYPRVSKL
jgi:hypothetical protein